MIRLLTLKIKIILLFIVLIIGVLLGGYLYLNKMNIVSGNLNINKTNIIDRLCNYNIYSDFYYRITDNENSYSKLTPIKTTICYDFKSGKIELDTKIDNQNAILLDDNNAVKINKEISLLKSFQEDYGKIIATQDKDYFDKSYTLANDNYKFLFNKDIDIKVINPLDEYYTKISNLPIDNMVVNYYKLKEIKSLPIQATKDGGWQPNILEWNFAENDKIYLQYLDKLKKNDLDDYINSEYSRKDKTIVKLTKFNNNKLSKMFLIFDNNQNKVTTLFMDNNGYVYNLILKVQNKKAFKTYFNDFMKISYGIYFVKKDNFKNNFAREQENAIRYYSLYKNYSKFYYTNNKCSNGYSENNYKFDKKFKIFKSRFGSYPNINIFNKINEDYKKCIESLKNN